MYFRINSESVELVEPDDLKSFHAVRPVGLAHGELAEIVQKARPGRDPAGRRPSHGAAGDGPREWLPGRVGPGWQQDFEAMIAYAARKGWLSDDGTQVRAHLEAEQV